MAIRLLRIGLCELAMLLLLCSAALPRSNGSGPNAELTALVGAKIYPSPNAPAIENAIVIVRNGKISAVGSRKEMRVPAGAKAIDCTGKTIIAGLWNSHVHFTELKWMNAGGLPAAQLTSQLQEMLTGYGFTSVVDTGSISANTVALRKRIESGEVAGPRILTAGSPIYPHNGIPYYVLETLPPEIIKQLNQPSTAEEAVRAVDEDVAQGTDVIKLFVVSWVKRDGKPTPFPMNPEIVKAATDEAHRKGKLVFAHPSTIQGVELVLQGHVDVLAHTIEDPANWTDAVVARLKAANVSLIPTLTLFSGDDDAEGIRHEVKTFAHAGGRILFGTDIGFITNYPVLTHEFEFLSRAGLTFPQILASLTTNPAERLGFGKTSGRIAKDMDADLVVLDGDPAKDVMAFSRVQMTLRRGKVIYSAK